MSPSQPRRLLAETLGSLLLATIVVGSGIAAQQLSPKDVGLQLTENAVATACGLFALILMFAPISGAHFNPIISLVDAMFGHRSWPDALAYIPAQILGCVLGVILANLMFARPPVTLSTTDRMTGPHFLGEIVATAGLVLVVFVLARTGRGHLAPAAVGAYIGAAYFFTSSTSFANPAITIGRILTDTFAGIAVSSAPGYLGAQLLGGLLGYTIVRALCPSPEASHTGVAQPAPAYGAQ